jgi:hypothetical protein
MYNKLVMDAAPNTPVNEEKVEPQAVVVRREPERDLVTWTAPARPFKKRDRQYFVTIFATAGIISLVIFLAEGLMPVVLIISLVFLYYILSTVPPEDVEYKITTKGIKIGDKLTDWQLLQRFWFGKRMDSDILFFDTFQIPGRIEFVIKPEINEVLEKEISAYIPFEKAPDTGLDKLTNWVSQKLQGNK